MSILDWVTIVISGLSLLYSYKANKFSREANNISHSANELSKRANKLSEKANKMSSKSISIDYDATFNDFHIQLQKNNRELFRLRNDIENILTQDSDHIINVVPQIIDEMVKFQTQKQFMRPSKYADHYDALERLCEDIKGNLEIILQIAIQSNQEKISHISNFRNWYHDTLEIYDKILGCLEEKIAEASGI